VEYFRGGQWTEGGSGRKGVDFEDFSGVGGGMPLRFQLEVVVGGGGRLTVGLYLNLVKGGVLPFLKGLNRCADR
jgi:hypothetical protein